MGKGAATIASKKKGGISNFFFKVENVPDENEITSPAQTKTTVSAAPAGIGVGQEDAKIREVLAAALEEANMEGYDYFEFAKALEAVTTIIPSEALRFQSTFASAAVQGVTVDKLISSAQHYLQVLDKANDDFAKTVQNRTNETVTSKETAIQKIDADMQTKAEQIKKLTEEINVMQQQKTSVTNEIAQSQAEIVQAQNKFAATLKVFVDRISGDITKIKTYLTKTA